jgi:putative flippase GtrA
VTVVSEYGRVARFLAVGLLNTFVGLATIYSCKWFLGTGDVISNVIGYAVGLTNSFAWNRRWTFAHSGPMLPAAVRFAVVFLFAYFLNLATMLAAIHAFDLNSYLAHAIATVPYTALFYLGSRFFVFVR